jgi:gluconolactonase
MRFFRSSPLFAFLVLLAFAALVRAQNTQLPPPRPVFVPPAPPQIVRLDPGLDAIVAPSAQVEKIAGDLGFTEGPVWQKRGGFLLFSDIPNNVVDKLDRHGNISVFLASSGYDGTVPPPPKPLPYQGGAYLRYLFGSNGLAIDMEGRLILCEHGNRRVTRLEKDGKRTIIADRYEGKRFNSPDDIIVKSDDSIYFTDPPYGLPATHAQQEIPFTGVYRVKDGKVDLLIKDHRGANGLAFTPDEKFLIVNDSAARNYTKYPVKPDGLLGDPTLFYDFSKGGGPVVPDGMKIDSRGDVWATGTNGLWILSPDAKPLGRIELPEVPVNMAFGEKDGKTLFITARTSLYRIRLKVSGPRPH